MFFALANDVVQALHSLNNAAFFRHRWSYHRKEALENKFKNDHEEARSPKLK